MSTCGTLTDMSSLLSLANLHFRILVMTDMMMLMMDFEIDFDLRIIKDDFDVCSASSETASANFIDASSD
jgi:hypothetical protein